jgi:hypothetical protein
MGQCTRRRSNAGFPADSGGEARGFRYLLCAQTQNSPRLWNAVWAIATSLHGGASRAHLEPHSSRDAPFHLTPMRASGRGGDICLSPDAGSTLSFGITAASSCLWLHNLGGHQRGKNPFYRTIGNGLLLASRCDPIGSMRQPLHIRSQARALLCAQTEMDSSRPSGRRTPSKEDG